MTTWLITRAAGTAAFVTLFASVAWGLIATTGVVAKRIAKPTSIAVHQFLGSVALVLVGLHLGTLFVDRFVPFDLGDLLIPLRSEYRPVAVAAGIVSLYLTIVVVVSSWLRKRIGPARWRRLHLLTVPAFALGLWHGLSAGTDSVQPWAFWLYILTAVVIVFLLVARAYTAGIRPARRAVPPGVERVARPASREEPVASTAG